MRHGIVSLIAGLLFGAGLLISGMMDRFKVMGFLDIFGDWDPSLLFVMGGALSLTIPFFYLVRKKGAPLLAESFNVPLKQHIDMPLMLGAILFGLGWGLYGYCPGPILASLGSLDWEVLVFVFMMALGMICADKTQVYLDSAEHQG